MACDFSLSPPFFFLNPRGVKIWIACGKERVAKPAVNCSFYLRIGQLLTDFWPFFIKNGVAERNQREKKSKSHTFVLFIFSLIGFFIQSNRSNFFGKK